MNVEYHIIKRAEIDDTVRETFARMLCQQGKVQPPFEEKADRCKLLCVASVDGEVVGIGGIKVKTGFDFPNAGVPELADAFEWELGYLYTKPESGGRGIGSSVARLLIQKYGEGNLMASTEVSANPRMGHARL